MTRHLPFFVMLLVLLGCNTPPSTPETNTTSNPPPLNTRTGLSPDPPGVKAGGAPFADQKPGEVDNAGKLINNFQKLDEIPLAYITFKNTPGWCSGVLVSDKDADAYIVVTAAHCFWDDNKRFYEPKNVYIMDKAGKWVLAEQVFYERSDIDDAEYKDIGLIRLKNKPSINTYPPIPIGGRAYSTDANPQAIWESKELKVGTEVYSWGYTSRRWIKRATIAMTGTQLWGAQAGRDMRKWVIPTKYEQSFGGDSGGPLVVKVNNVWHLIGVLQGFKPENLYTAERTITFTWVDGYMQNIWDANANKASHGMALPDKLDPAMLQNY